MWHANSMKEVPRSKQTQYFTFADYESLACGPNICSGPLLSDSKSNEVNKPSTVLPYNGADKYGVLVIRNRLPLLSPW